MPIFSQCNDLAYLFQIDVDTEYRVGGMSLMTACNLFEQLVQTFLGIDAKAERVAPTLKNRIKRIICHRMIRSKWRQKQVPFRMFRLLAPVRILSLEFSRSTKNKKNLINSGKIFCSWNLFVVLMKTYNLNVGQADVIIFIEIRVPNYPHVRDIKRSEVTLKFRNIT